jgi:hypothetical protein
MDTTISNTSTDTNASTNTTTDTELNTETTTTTTNVNDTLSNTKYYISQINKDKRNGYIIFTNLNPTDTTSPSILQEANRKYFKQNNNNTAQLHINKLPVGKVITLGFVFYNKDNASNIDLLKINEQVILTYNTDNTFSYGDNLKKYIFISENNRLKNNLQYCIILKIIKNNNNITNLDININNELYTDQTIRYYELEYRDTFNKLNMILGNNYYIGSINLNAGIESYYNTIKAKYDDMFPTIIEGEEPVVTQVDAEGTLIPKQSTKPIDTGYKGVIHYEFSLDKEYLFKRDSNDKILPIILFEYNDIDNLVYIKLYINAKETQTQTQTQTQTTDNIIVTPDNLTYEYKIMGVENEKKIIYPKESINIIKNIYFTFNKNNLIIKLENNKNTYESEDIELIPKDDYNNKHPYYNYKYDNKYLDDAPVQKETEIASSVTKQSGTSNFAITRINPYNNSEFNNVIETFSLSNDFISNNISGIINFYKNLM